MKAIPPHGTTSRYTSIKHQCRCNKCKKAAVEYQRQRRLNNAEVREKDRIGNLRRRKEVTDYLYKLKEETPCTDCGLNYPYYVMDFDHLDGSNKSINVSAAPTLRVALE